MLICPFGFIMRHICSYRLFFISSIPLSRWSKRLAPSSKRVDTKALNSEYCNNVTKRSSTSFKIAALLFSNCSGVTKSLFLNKKTITTTKIGAYSTNVSDLIYPLNSFCINIYPYSVGLGHYPLILQK